MTTEDRTADQLNWQSGGWSRGAASASTARITIASDWAPIRRFAPIIETDPEAVYGDLLPALRRSDLRIVNLECPLSAQNRPMVKSGSVLKGAPSHVRGLTAVPFEIVTLANNHVFDQGRDAFDETLRLLAENGIRWVGAGITAEAASRPLTVDVNGIRLAIVNFSEGEDLTAAGEGPGVLGWEVQRVCDRVRALRGSAHAIVAICHGGIEYIPFPPPYVARAFKRIADAGADLVVGHHPHVPQGVQIHHGVPICYSLGNFVFFQETDLVYRKMGYLVEADISRNGIDRISIVPYAIRDGGLVMLSGQPRTAFFEALKRVSTPLTQDGGIEAAWNGFLQRYGQSGLVKEIDMILSTMAQDPPKGAAMFRNRITTPQHNRHWVALLTRIMDRTIDDAPSWAIDLAEEWLTRTSQ